MCLKSLVIIFYSIFLYEKHCFAKVELLHSFLTTYLLILINLLQSKDFKILLITSLGVNQLFIRF